MNMPTKTPMKIVIYTNPHCPYSAQAKKFFKKKKLPFEEKTLFKEKRNRLEMFELSSQLATPVIKIDEHLIIGFDENRLKELLKNNK